MSVFTYETEFSSVIPPARLFKAFVLDADNLIPKIAPQAVKSAEKLLRRWSWNRQEEQLCH
ncbi:putative START-like domain, Bet v I type allergen [Rosa chinensis]|uniref:Putative START-like domain, Bet v I type allergen n=1 Tax=Rosa chinensis TaxID=74649 RepID=A0A2P6PAQ6_ROSCH|nr:putative START-like domain, Bet v I type allergen [Rosa chinensis]